MTKAIHQAFPESYLTMSDDNWRVLIILVVILLNYPLTVQRDFSKLSFVSVIGFGLIIYIILLVVAETPLYIA